MKHWLSSKILLVSVSLFCLPMLSLCLLLCLPLMFLCAVALYTNAWAMYFYCCRWTSLWKELLCGLPLHPSAVIQWNYKLLRAIPFVLSKSDPHVCRLDVYSSINARSSGVLVLFVYGSATPQSKRLYAPMASRLRDLGYIVVVPQYRQECACYDIREAIKYATKIVPSEMIYILGHGTAADVATQIVFEDVLAKVKCLAEQDKGKHSLLLQQPLDFLPQIEGLLLFAGCYSESIAGMIHAHHALFKMSNDLLDLFPRILFVHGNKDSTVPVQESIDMYNMLGEALPPERRQDVDVRMRLYKSLSHVQCIQSLYKDIKDFIGDTLQ